MLDVVNIDKGPIVGVDGDTALTLLIFYFEWQLIQRQVCVEKGVNRKDTVMPY